VDYSGFLKAADAGQPPAVALLHGPDAFLLSDAAARVGRGLFGDAPDLSLSREVLEAREAGAAGIVEAALTLPWTGARRLIVARGIDELNARAADEIAAYCASPNPSSVLLLLAGQSLAAAHWLNKAVPRQMIVAALPPTGGQIAGWLRDRARAEGIELSADAALLLIELGGDDLARLRGDVVKAALAGGPDNRRVGPAEVRAVVGETRARHVFELTRAIVARDVGAALGLLGALLAGGEDPGPLLGMLAREARAAWLAAEGLRRGRPDAEIARGLGRPPGPAAELVARARSLSPESALRLVHRCWEADRRLKLGGMPRAELSLLVADLCAG